MTANLVTVGLTKYFKPNVLICCTGKNDSFQNILLLGNLFCHLKALMEIHNEIRVVFMFSNTVYIHSVTHGWRISSNSKAYYLRHTYHKAVTSSSSDGSDGF